MVNAWSLAGSILSGTFDEDYPIMKKNTKDEPQPTITDTGKFGEHSDYYYDYTRNDPNAENPFTDPVDRARAEFVVGGGNTASHENFYGYENDGLDYEIDLMADVDDQRSHHFQTGNEELNYQPKTAHFYKYH